MPDFGEGAVTDKKGNIIGTTGFIQCHSEGAHATRLREERNRHREAEDRKREELNDSWNQWLAINRQNGTDPYR